MPLRPSLKSALGRAGLWLCALFLAIALFCVAIGSLSGSNEAFLLFFRITTIYALPVGCLFLPIVIVFGNLESRRSLRLFLLSGILVGPISMAILMLFFELKGEDPQRIWHGDPLTGIGGFTTMLFALFVGSATTILYLLGLRTILRSMNPSR